MAREGRGVAERLSVCGDNARAKGDNLRLFNSLLWQKCLKPPSEAATVVLSLSLSLVDYLNRPICAVSPTSAPPSPACAHLHASLSRLHRMSQVRRDDVS